MIYKLGGKDGQYDPTLTLIPQPEQKHDRDNWQSALGNGFQEPSGVASLSRVLAMVCGAVRID